MKLVLMLAGWLLAAGSVQAQQVTVQRQFSIDKTVPDNNTLRAGFTWDNSGISYINSVSATFGFSSPNISNPIDLSDLSGSIKHGLTGEANARTGSFFTAGQLTSETQTFAGNTGLQGDWLGSNYFRADINDNQGGGIAKLDSILMSITGTAKNSGTMDLGAGGSLTASAGTTTTVGATLASAGASDAAINLVASSGDLNLTGGISGVGEFNKTGAGTVNIGSSTNFTGRLNVNAGKVVVDGALGSTSVTVVGTNAILGGSGTVGVLQIASGGTLAVGDSPGQLNAGNTTWAGGAELDWEVVSSVGNQVAAENFLAGKGTNWDFLNITGTLNITATSGSKFIIDVISLFDNSTGGLAAGFDLNTSYTFGIATASGGIQIGGVGLDGYANLGAFNSALSALFDINTGSFANNPGSDGLWSISTAAGTGTERTLLLSYAGTPGGGGGGGVAIPEPSSAALTLIGLGVLALRRRRAARG